MADGGYLECSFDGRFDCPAGAIIVHPTLHRHANDFGDGGARVVNVPLPDDLADAAGFRVVRSSAIAELMALAETRPADAANGVLEECAPVAPVSPPGWLDRFFGLVLGGLSIAAAAEVSGVTSEHASRTAKIWYGDSPIKLRRERMIRVAVDALRDGVAPAGAAAEAGFADQPHLTRVLKHATGLTPAMIGRVQAGGAEIAEAEPFFSADIKFVQEQGRGAR